MNSTIQEHFNAEPTKDFFIDFLTKDISLEKAIIDLIDNSIDAAKNKLTSTSLDYDFTGYKADLTINESKFVIQDNCGGFSLNDAKNYAFRFGRPEDAPNLGTNSIGRFGVGMKRALFKIGKTIYVESKTVDGDHFCVNIDTDIWRNKKKKIKGENNVEIEITDWSFEFNTITNGSAKISNGVFGTYIEIQNLRDEIKEDFGNPVYRKKLRTEIEKTLAYSIDKKFVINYNSSIVSSQPVLLLSSDEIKPYYKQIMYGNVEVEIYAGVGEPSPDDAGWYIYCNDRLMINANKENLTGWQGGKNYFNDTGVQKYHNKVAMFRGLVFFSSNDSKELPMTTTKTGIDSNSHIYKSAREHMIEAMKIVLEKLNEIENSKTRKVIVQDSNKKDIKEFSNSQLSSTFEFPEIIQDDAPQNQKTISYKVDLDLYEAVKDNLGVSKPNEVGIETFRYYMKMFELE